MEELFKLLHRDFSSPTGVSEERLIKMPQTNSESKKKNTWLTQTAVNHLSHGLLKPWLGRVFKQAIFLFLWH